MTEASSQSLSGADARIGQLIDGKYEIEALIGRGSSGSVYRANHQLLGTKVAIKILNKDKQCKQQDQDRFVNEAKILMQLTHPHIVQTRAFGFSQYSEPYMVMELLQGQTLKSLIAQSGAFSVRDSLHISIQLFSALVQAHEQGAIHRDLSPNNIMAVKNSQGVLQIKLFDFGLAKIIDESDPSLTKSRTIKGTAAYMSPEQCQSKTADRRSDIYSAACVIYEVLTARPPFAGSSDYEVMHKQIFERTEFKPEDNIWPPLEKVLLCCLEKDPEARYQDCRLLLIELEKLNEQFHTGSLDAKAKDQALRGRLTKPFLFCLGIGLVIIALTTGALLTRSNMSKTLTQTGKSGVSRQLQESKHKRLGKLSLESLNDKSYNWFKPSRGFSDLDSAISNTDDLCKKIETELKMNLEPERRRQLNLMLMRNRLWLVERLNHAGEFKASGSVLEKAEDSARLTGDPEQTAKANLTRMNYFFQAGDYQSCIALKDKIQNTPNISLQLQLQLFVCSAYTCLKNWSELLKHSLTAQSFYKQMGQALLDESADLKFRKNLKLQADISKAIAAAHLAEQDILVEALKDIRAAAEEQKHRYSELTSVLIHLRECAQFDIHKRFCRESLNKLDRTYIIERAILYSELINAAADQNNWLQAKSLEKEAEESIPHEAIVASSIIDQAKADSLIRQGQVHEAARIAIRTIDLLSNSSQASFIAAVQTRKALWDAAKIMRIAGEEERERLLLKKFLQVCKKGNCMHLQRLKQAEASLRLSEIELSKGNYSESVTFAKEGLEIASYFKDQERALYKKLQEALKLAQQHA